MMRLWSGGIECEFPDSVALVVEVNFCSLERENLRMFAERKRELRTKQLLEYTDLQS